MYHLIAGSGYSKGKDLLLSICMTMCKRWILGIRVRGQKLNSNAVEI